MAEPSKLSPSQAAEVLQVHPRTLRRYCKAFANALSSSASVTGKKRYFDSSDIETLRRAQKYLSEGMNMEEVAEILPIRPSNQENQSPLVLSTESAIIVGELRERTRGVVVKVDEHDERIRQLEERIAELEKGSDPWWKRFLRRFLTKNTDTR